MAKKKKPGAKLLDERSRQLTYEALVRVLPNLTVGPLLRDSQVSAEAADREPPAPPPTAESIGAYMAAEDDRVAKIMSHLKEELGGGTYTSLIGLQERSFTDFTSIDGESSAELGLLRISEDNQELAGYLPSEIPLDAAELALLNDVDMDKLYALLSPEEQQVLEQSGAFHKTALPSEMFTERFLYPHARYDEVVHPPVGDVEVHSKPPTDLLAAQHVADEIQYINTILEASEARQLASELYYELRAGRPVTHLALSDLVADAVSPSLVERYLISADATYKYSTAQYLKAYEALREAKLQYEVDLLCSRMEGLFAALEANYFTNRPTFPTLADIATIINQSQETDGGA